MRALVVVAVAICNDLAHLPAQLIHLLAVALDGGTDDLCNKQQAAFSSIPNVPHATNWNGSGMCSNVEVPRLDCWEDCRE